MVGPGHSSYHQIALADGIAPQSKSKLGMFTSRLTIKWQDRQTNSSKELDL